MNIEKKMIIALDTSAQVIDTVAREIRLSVNKLVDTEVRDIVGKTITLPIKRHVRNEIKEYEY